MKSGDNAVACSWGRLYRASGPGRIGAALWRSIGPLSIEALTSGRRKRTSDELASATGPSDGRYTRRTTTRAQKAVDVARLRRQARWGEGATHGKDNSSPRRPQYGGSRAKPIRSQDAARHGADWGDMGSGSAPSRPRRDEVAPSRRGPTTGNFSTDNLRKRRRRLVQSRAALRDFRADFSLASFVAWPFLGRVDARIDGLWSFGDGSGRRVAPQPPREQLSQTSSGVEGQLFDVPRTPPARRATRVDGVTTIFFPQPAFKMSVEVAPQVAQGRGRRSFIERRRATCGSQVLPQSPDEREGRPLATSPRSFREQY